mmetsp:Transcript_7917/g.25979  ORF Transcript_7917/g.25979 Transcript_7917/m.25979 type:complete len:349 (-) Transcript_7917:6772-7818(-)
MAGPGRDGKQPGRGADSGGRRDLAGRAALRAHRPRRGLAAAGPAERAWPLAAAARQGHDRRLRHDRFRAQLRDQRHGLPWTGRLQRRPVRGGRAVHVRIRPLWGRLLLHLVVPGRGDSYEPDGPLQLDEGRTGAAEQVHRPCLLPLRCRRALAAGRERAGGRGAAALPPAGHRLRSGGDARLCTGVRLGGRGAAALHAADGGERRRRAVRGATARRVGQPAVLHGRDWAARRLPRELRGDRFGVQHRRRLRRPRPVRCGGRVRVRAGLVWAGLLESHLPVLQRRPEWTDRLAGGRFRRWHRAGAVVLVASGAVGGRSRRPNHVGYFRSGTGRKHRRRGRLRANRASEF